MQGASSDTGGERTLIKYPPGLIHKKAGPGLWDNPVVHTLRGRTANMATCGSEFIRDAAGGQTTNVYRLAAR